MCRVTGLGRRLNGLILQLSFMRPRCWLDISPLAPREIEMLAVEVNQK